MKEKLNKYITNIFILVFILLFSYFEGINYYNFYKDIQFQKIEKKKVISEANNFNVSKINCINNIDFYYTPYKDLLNKLIFKIDHAKNKIYVEIYMLTETRIEKALVRAKNRGLDVKVILEKNPYKSPGLNKKAYDFLKKNGILVVYSNIKNYFLNHSKIIIIDNLIFLSTGNFTYSSFTKNREFMLFINDDKLYKKFNKIFLGDYLGKKIYVYDNDLIISPDYSRIKLEKLILDAKATIKLYFPYLEDKELENILIQKAKEGVKIDLITGIDSAKNIDTINNLKKNNIFIKLIKIPKIHAKSILVDELYLYIGSINFSTYSLDKNRELGIVFKNQKIIKKFLKVFINDLKD